MDAEWSLLVASWQLALEADGYSPATRRTYAKAADALTSWLEKSVTLTDLAPAGLSREHVRGWLVHVRQTRSSATARTWFAGVRSLCRWLVAEGEAGQDATEGIRTPRAGEPSTPVLGQAELRRLLKVTEGADFASRRDQALLLAMLDGGLRLAEVGGLQLADVDLPDRMLYVSGKGSRRSGPRLRAIPLGVRATRSLDRYIRARRRHPLAHRPELWLGAQGRALSVEGIRKVVGRRGAQAGLKQLHPHALRHSWAAAFRQAGGSEGDLLVLGGWRSRAQLDRYGKATAQERAAEAARRYSLGDRL
jgi:site-specific recombinase XerC